MGITKLAAMMATVAILLATACSATYNSGEDVVPATPERPSAEMRTFLNEQCEIKVAQYVMYTYKAAESSVLEDDWTPWVAEIRQEIQKGVYKPLFKEMMLICQMASDN